MPRPPRVLSRELRLQTGPDLRRRRWVFGLSLIGTAAAQIVSLLQMGLTQRLPDPPRSVPSTPIAWTPPITPTAAPKRRTAR